MEILKRSLSAFLALILVVGMIPVPASASEIAIESAAAETAAAETPAAEVPETVPVTTAPAQTVPETAVSVETVPETTAPAETVPATTAPAETVPETTAPAETVPETTAPAETVPETTAPQETEPAETVEENTASEEAMSTVTASGICGDDLSWVYDEVTRTLSISGSGYMYDYEWLEGENRSSANWVAFADQIRSVVLGEGVYSLGSYAFAGCTALTNVVLNEELETIGEGAFAYCTGISYLRIPASVTEVGSGAFRGCFTSGSEQLRFEGDVPAFEEDTFADITVMVRYPFSCNDAWADAASEIYSGNLTWKPYNDADFITETTLQQWIEEGETELVIDSDAFLEGSFTLPGDVTLTIASGGSLAVYAQSALTVAGTLIVDGGSLTVHEGGTLAVNGTLENRNDGYVDIFGTCTIGADGRVINIYENGTYGNFTGIPAADQQLKIYAHADEDLPNALAFMEENGYTGCEAYILEAVSLYDDMTIPENCTIYITEGSLSIDGNVTLDGDIHVAEGEETNLSVSGRLDVYGQINVSGTLENQGSMEVKSGGHVYSDYDGTVVNNGQITVNPNGSFEVEYNWYGTDPVDNGGTLGGDVFEMNAALLERRTAEFFARGENYILWRPFTADADLTIPEGETLNARGTITIPDGVTMTVNCDFVCSCDNDDDEVTFVTVEEGGQLIIGENGRMFISCGNVEVHGTLTNNGTVDDDADEKALIVYGTVYNEANLSGNISIYGQVINRSSLYNMCPDTESFVTVHRGGSLVNEGSIDTEGMILEVETGATLTNNAVIENNMGTIKIDGKYVHADNARLLQIVTEEGVGEITGIPKNQQLLYAEIYDDTDFGTVANNLAYEMENGYPQGIINVWGEEVTLSDSITVPENVTLNFEYGTAIIDGSIALEGGLMNVSEEAVLENNGDIVIYANSRLNNEGQIISSGSIAVYEDGRLYNAGGLENTETGFVEVQENGTLINDGSLVNSGTVDISGLTITYSYVYNEGVVSVYEGGQLYIYGDWEGEPPVNEGGIIIGDTENAPISQEELETLLAEAAEMEEPFLLDGPAILERNFVIPEGAVLEVGNNGSFVIPKGMTFTVNGALVLDPGAQLDIPEGSRLVNNGSIAVYTNHESDGHLYVEGTYTHRRNAVTLAYYNHDSVDTITGIANKNITLECYAQEESTLVRCMDLTTRNSFAGAQIVSVVGSYWETFTIPKNVSVTLLSPLEDEEYLVTLNGKIVVAGTVTVAENVAISMEGTMSVSTGGVVNYYGSLTAPNEEDPTNIPVNSGGKIYPAVSGISVEMDGADVTGDTAYVNKETLEEGYVELTVVTETSDEYYNALPVAKWASDKASIVDASQITYHGDGVFRIPIKEKGIGTVKLTATSIDGSKKTASVTLNVFYVDPAKKLTYWSGVPTIGLQQGDEAEIQIWGEDRIYPEYLEFTSSNEDVVTVDEYGFVTGGEKVGTANIVAAIKDDPLNRRVVVAVKVIAPQTQALYLTHDEPNQAEEDAVKLDLADLGGESYTFFIYPEAYDRDGLMELTGKSLKWTSSNTKLATVKGLSDGTAEVTIKAKQDGMAVITAETTDLAKIKRTMSLTVMDYSPRLGSTTVSLNPYKEESGQVTLIPSYGNEIMDVYFENEDLPLTAYYDEGVLTIYPTEDLKNGTINAKLIVLCEREDDNGEYKETEYVFNLKIAVKSTLPSVTLKQVGKFDLFYTDSTVQIQATAKNENITDMYLESDVFDLEFDPDTGVATVMYNDYFASFGDLASVSTRAKLYIELEGYYEYVEKTITISASKTKPSLAANPTSSVINTRLSGDYKTYFQIYNKTAKTTMALTGSDINGEYVSSVSESGLVCLDFGGSYSGSTSVQVQLDNWLEPITVKHTVKMSETLPKAKLGSSTVKLNTALAGGETAEIPVTLGANVRITRFLGLEQNSGYVTLTYDADRSMLLASLRRGYTGTYKYELTPVVENSAGQEIRLDPVKLTVQAKNANVTVSQRSSGKLDALDAASAITYTISKIGNAQGRITNVALAREGDYDMFELTGLTTDASGNQTFQLKLIEEKRVAGEYSTKTSYQVRLVYTICGKTISAPSVLKLRVTQSKVTLAAPAITFYQAQDLPMRVNLTSGAAIDRIGINGTKTSKEIVAALGSPVQATMSISDDRKDAQISLDIKEPGQLVAGRTYKLVLNVYPIGNTSDSAATQITINVKVAK